MSGGLIRQPNLRDPDGFYAALVDAHQGLSDEASELLNARLVLILANHVGNPQALREALALARLPPAPDIETDIRKEEAKST